MANDPFRPSDPNAPQAAPGAVPTGTVIGTREGYRFAEDPVPQKTQVTVLESPKVAPELPAPAKIDPGFDALKIAVEARLAGSAIAPMVYAHPTATRWFRFSPFELYMEQVLAKKLWTLE